MGELVAVITTERRIVGSRMLSATPSVTRRLEPKLDPIAPDVPKRMSVVEVSERGPGIPEPEWAVVFRPFGKLDAARSPQTGGFGVGLAIAKRAVKLHNGNIMASNRPGRGVPVQMAFPTDSNHG